MLNMKKLLALIPFISTLALATPALATPEWFGAADGNYNTICIDGPSNARLSPDFSNNIRAVLVDGSCGNLMYDGRYPMYENGFVLLEFYVAEINEWRRYWIHQTQIEEFYL